MIGENLCESPIEERFYAAMKSWMGSEGDKGIDCICQHEIDCYRLDFILMWNGARILAVECDGHDWHEKTKEQAARDKGRDRWLLCEYGLPTLRFTGSEIHRNAESCVEQALQAAHGIAGSMAWADHLEGARG